MEKLPSIIKGKYVEKGWGHELHIENNNDYCGKLLVFNKGKKFSMHYHVEKYETWFIQKGKLRFKWINPSNANIV
jgi:mannose-6-phosphate isomerase-like protein (cupin superfamily)